MGNSAERRDCRVVVAALPTFDDAGAEKPETFATTPRMAINDNRFHIVGVEVALRVIIIVERATRPGQRRSRVRSVFRCGGGFFNLDPHVGIP